MYIELTNDQIDSIFDGFDWDGYFEDWLNEDIIANWLNKYPEFILDYLKYKTDIGADNYFKNNKEELLEVINDL